MATVLLITITAWLLVLSNCTENKGTIAAKYDNSHLRRSDFEKKLKVSPESALNSSMPWLSKSDCTKIANKSKDEHLITCPNDAANSISILTMYCVTSSEDANAVEVGKCIYGSCTKHFCSHNIIPNNQSVVKNKMCAEYKRNGTLCGRCQEDYYPPVYSFDMKCVKCTHGKSNWWKYLLVAFLPITVFYVIVIYFKINITSSPLHGFVFFSQIISMPVVMRSIIITTQNEKYAVQWLIRIVASFYGVWNLDFFRSFQLNICLKTDTLPTLALDLVPAVYPLLLIFLSFLLVELHDRNWEIKTSLVDGFAKFC